ncbi:MAG TPA: Ig-like domain-containing protein [Polyangiaceae bacterium]
MIEAPTQLKRWTGVLVQTPNRRVQLVAALLASAWAGSAQATLKAAGPVTFTTLPAWYQDTNGVALEPCVDQNGFCILTPAFDPAVTTPPAPITTTGPISDANWPNEGFYFLADSTITGFGGPAVNEKAVLRLALEGAFLNGVAPNQGITFLRVNLQRMAGLTPGVYTVTHPYGSFTFTVDATGKTALVNGQAFRAEDPIAPSPGVYFPPEMRTGVLTGIGPFLSSAAGLVTDPASGHVYIGDPRVATAVVGSPTGNNFFRIDGPNVGGPGVNSVQTSLFNLSGKVFTGKIPLFVGLDRITYARNGTSGHVDAFVSGTPGAVLDIAGVGIGTTPLKPSVTAPGDRFFAIVPFAGTLPSSVVVTNHSDVVGGVPSPTAYPVTLVDEVNVTQADFDPVAKTLTLKAASRDTIALPTLTAVNIPLPTTLDATGSLVVPLGDALPPMVVEVQSSLGGVGTLPVSVPDGIAAANQPPVAVSDSAATVSGVPLIIDVLANDTDPDGNPLSIVTVTPPANGSVVNNAGSTVTYTASAGFTGVDAFTYTISDGLGGTSTATVTVTVSAVVNAPPVATPDVATTPFNTPVAIPVLANDSDANGDVLSVSAVTQPASGVVTTNGTTVSFAPTAGFSGATSFTYTVVDGNGGSAIGLVTVTVLPAEALNVTAAVYTASRTEWRVSGTSTVNGATVTIHAGATLAGTVIGTAPVVAGVWTFRSTTTGVPSNTRVSVQSTGGGTQLNQTVTVR